MSTCIWLAVSIHILLSFSKAQQNNNTPILQDINKSSSITPFFEKMETIGSPYLSKNWMQGVAELKSGRHLPEPEQPLLFNYDKLNSVLYTIDGQNQIVRYVTDSVLSFSMSDGFTIYPFEKVIWISDHFFLIPITKSPKGYSLYKRLYTKLHLADFSSEGYFTKGKRYDEYADYFEYYITYPGNKKFEKISLREKEIRKALKVEKALLNQFFSIHEAEINEQSLIGLIQFVDEKKYPE